MSKKTTEKQNKSEIETFKKRYLYKNLNSFAISNNHPNSFDNILNALKQCKNFERPDGYFFDEETATLYIFEHFEFDCSETNRNGSKLRKNISKVNNEIESEIKNSAQSYNSTKAIVQGYGVKDGNSTIFYMGKDGDKFRNNYIKNFKRQFERHSSKIQDYIDHCKQEINATPIKILTIFVIEDITMGGTYYKHLNGMGEPVILPTTKQFVEIFKNSKIDYVFFGMLQYSDLIICDRSITNDNLDKYIDLYSKEFFVFPMMPQITVAKKLT
ncbi:MAG: hypothetical protein HFE25_01725 [Clostridia bacterium]|nr:hypothetical protein [Clostridia bacterium]